MSKLLSLLGRLKYYNNMFDFRIVGMREKTMFLFKQSRHSLTSGLSENGAPTKFPLVVKVLHEWWIVERKCIESSPY